MIMSIHHYEPRSKSIKIIICMLLVCLYITTGIMASSRKKVIIDTDCGVDDAMAIMLTLGEKSVDVIAMTAVFGNTKLVNSRKNVLRVLNVCNKNVPVFSGSNGPLSVPNGPEANFFGSDGLGNVSEDFPTGYLQISPIPAAETLVYLAKQHPKEITLMVIGPLTNIAIAHRLDPQFTENLKEIYCLGGNYKDFGKITENVEFNFYSDPLAANIVMTEAACPVTLISWELTIENAIDWDYYDQLIQVNTPKGHLFKATTNLDATVRRKKSATSYLDCDFIAAAVALHPEVVKSTTDHFVSVKYCSGNSTNGMINLKPTVRHQKTVSIVTQLNKKLLDELRMKMLQ